MIRTRKALLVAIVALTFLATGCSPASPSASSPTTPSALPAGLYVQHGTKLVEWNPLTKKYGAALPHVSTTNLWSIAANNRTVFWTQLVGGTHTDLYSMPRTGGAVTLLAKDVEPSGLLVATKDRLYWAGSAIWTMPVDGSTRPQILLDTHPRDGSAADGLAVDDKYLYFSQCDSDRIGRIPQYGRPLPKRPQWLAHPSPCSREIAVAHGSVYYDTDYSDSIGRVTLNPVQVFAPWAKECSSCVLAYPGPGSRLTAFGDTLYWINQTNETGPEHVALLRLDKSGFNSAYAPVGGSWMFAVPAG